MTKHITFASILLLTAVPAGGCDDVWLEPDDPPGVDAAPPTNPGDFAVRGTAAGVLASVVLELRAGNDVEPLTVAQDGTFSFATRLENGASYDVALVDQDIPCTLRNQTGVIAGADTAIELTCTGASLASLVVSGIAPAVTLVPGTTDYVVDVPLSQQSATLTATVAIPADTLTILGVRVDSGAPSGELTLSLGDNPVDVVVENNLGWRRTYRFTLRRAGRIAQYAYVKASNTSDDDEFGHVVAISGDTLAVAAQQAENFEGAVYVFRRTGTSWQQEAYLMASNLEFSSSFGEALALSGDTLAVGAPDEGSAARGVNGDQYDDSVYVGTAGAVYVFRRTGTSWQQEAYIKASNTGEDDEFGTTVALAGDTLAVGAPEEDSAAQGIDGDQDDDSATSSGAVYLFRRTGTTWQQEAYVKASDTGPGDEFGSSLALFDDRLAVGVPDRETVYLFRRSDTTWQQEAALQASNSEQHDHFGDSVSLAFGTLAVGATGERSGSLGVNGGQDDNRYPFAGAVYVFRHFGTTWQQEAYIKASNTGEGDRFGYSVSLSPSGDTLAVGAPAENSASQGIDGEQHDESAPGSGAVYVFRRTGPDWQQDAYVKASTNDASDFFGRWVALSGETTLVIGAPHEDSASQGVNGDQDDDSADSSGAVYVFH